MTITTPLKWTIAALAMASLASGVASLPARADTPVVAGAPRERLLPLQGGRNFRDLGGLKGVQALPAAKALFVRQALGLSGDMPDLARL